MEKIKMEPMKSCNLCGSRSMKFLLRGKDKMYPIEKEYNLFQCKKCGLIFVNPQPSKKELLKHYPEKKYYSLNKSSKGGSEMKSILQRVYYSKQNYFLKILLLLFKPFINSVKIIPGGRFLDVGCGSGELLSLMKEYNMECYGLEPGKFDKELAENKGTKIFNGNLEEANYLKEYFDVITMNHVLEHVENPTDTLKELKRIIKPDGTLIIGVPVSDCLAYSIFGESWIALDVPRHLYTYSKETLVRYARKADFKVEKIRYNSGPLQFAGSLLYFFGRHKKNQRYFSVMSNKRFLMVSLYILCLPAAHLCNLFKIGDQIEIFLSQMKNE